jgi:hypothetical protein
VHGELVAVLAAEELQLLIVRQVDLPEQDAVPRAPAEEGPQRPQVLVRLRERAVVGAVRLQ